MLFFMGVWQNEDAEDADDEDDDADADEDEEEEEEFSLTPRRKMAMPYVGNFFWSG
jgi:hypothetical protein